MLIKAILLILCSAITLNAAVTFDYKGLVEFSYYAPEATVVELYGSFNNWQGAPLKKCEDGFFKLDLYLPQGEYKYYFMINRLFKRADPDNPNQVNKQSVLNLKFGEILDYQENQLTVALVVNFQPSSFYKDFLLYEKLLTELKLLKIPLNITFNGVYLDYLAKNSKFTDWLNKSENIYLLGSSLTRTYLPWLQNNALKTLQLSNWKVAFNDVFHLGASVLSVPYLGVDSEVAHAAGDLGYQGILVRRTNEYYPYKIDDNRLTFFPAIPVLENLADYMGGKVLARCLNYLSEATEAGHFYPFLGLYWEVDNQTTLSIIESVLEELKTLKDEKSIRFKALPEYYPSITGRMTRDYYPDLIRPFNHHFTTSYLDKYYRDKFGYWLFYLKSNYPGSVLEGRQMEILEKIEENWFLKDESLFWDVQQCLNREYFTLMKKKPYSSYRNIKGENFLFLENRDFFCALDAHTGRLIEVYVKGKDRTLSDVEDEEHADVSIDNEKITFDFYEFKGDSLVFYKKLHGNLEDFILEKVFELDRKSSKLTESFRVKNAASVTRRLHLRYSGIGYQNQSPMMRWADSFDDGSWTVRASEFLLPAGSFLESKAFQLKPGEERKITLELLPR
ncbi:MAG: glycogen-binding domain-containing protein [Candidatus Wallbacteria bacterium]|nr:glycogen-binding domain-containing protein [Candidatus Wallbacteria bacterium]